MEVLYENHGIFPMVKTHGFPVRFGQVRQLDLSPGERGCASSHIRAWRYCVEPLGRGDGMIMDDLTILFV
jgi:GR25 family glycosyltransferase involved in LPS biosynthesis